MKESQDSIALWLLATDSICAEDQQAWQPTNPASARQLYGGFSSIPTLSKQSARASLLVSNAVPIKVGLRFPLRCRLKI